MKIILDGLILSIGWLRKIFCVIEEGTLIS
jgi:hypothetical protein